MTAVNDLQVERVPSNPKLYDSASKKNPNAKYSRSQNRPTLNGTLQDSPIQSQDLMPCA